MDIKALNQYRLENKISQTSHSVTYLAFDSVEKRDVTLLMLEKPVRYKPLLKQLQQLRHVRGPHLPLIFDVFGDESNIFICQEKLTGRSLGSIMAEDDPESFKPLSMLKALNDGISALHQKQVVHGNINLDTIIITDTSRIVLLNAGFTPFTDFSHDPLKSFPPEQIRFLSPEQLTRQPVTPASDFFSLGSVFFEFITGIQAFSGEATEQITASVTTATPDFARLKKNGLGSFKVLLFEKLLAKKPEERFVDTTELGATLKEIISLSEDPHKYEPPEKPSNPRKYLTFTVFVILLAILWLVLTTVSRMMG